MRPATGGPCAALAGVGAARPDDLGSGVGHTVDVNAEARSWTRVATGPYSPAISAPRASTSRSMAGVRVPVNMLRWLGW